ncbi:hypothetical protein C0J52_25287, partial [Blattella germanica]
STKPNVERKRQDGGNEKHLKGVLNEEEKAITLSKANISSSTSKRSAILKRVYLAILLECELYNLQRRAFAVAILATNETLSSSQTRQCMAYADDIVIMSRSLEVLNEVVSQIQREAEHMGLVINNRKTKYMRNARSSGINKNGVNINGCNYEEVDTFKYLGVLITQGNTADMDMRHKIAAGNRCLRALNKTMSSRYIISNINQPSQYMIESCVKDFISSTSCTAGKAVKIFVLDNLSSQIATLVIILETGASKSERAAGNSNYATRKQSIKYLCGVVMELKLLSGVNLKVTATKALEMPY